MPYVYRWIEITIDGRGRDRRRTLKYRMSDDEAIGRAAAHPGVRYEKVPGSAEEVSGVPYVGWGQVLKLRPEKD